MLAGNYIGIDSLGGVPLSNGANGVRIMSSAHENLIGGTDPGAGNTISGNSSGAGVVVEDPGTTGNTVVGNAIGTSADCQFAVPNGIGVFIAFGASNNTIGGLDPGAGNLIADNARIGVQIGALVTDTCVGNAILGNSVYANGSPSASQSLGIDLGGDKVTLNDSKGHTGPNHFQNFPVITSVFPATVGSVVSGTLDSNPSRTYHVEVFASPTPDPSGYGQGQTYLGFTNVTTDSRGHAVFSFTAVQQVAGQVITATATDLTTNDTSEFSKAVRTPTDVTGSLTLNRSGFVYNRVNGLFYGTITLTNNGATAITGTLELVLAGLTAGVTLDTGSGITVNGDPYINVDLNALFGASGLASGRFVKINLNFRKTSMGLYVDYNPRVYSLGS